MAVTRAKLDAAERTQMCWQLKTGVLVELAFDRVKLDDTDYYEPSAPGRRVGERGEWQKGVLVAQEVFDHPAPALPLPASRTQGQTAVWQYGGI